MLAAPAARQMQAIGDVGAAEVGRMAAVDMKNVEIEIGVMRGEIRQHFAQIAGPEVDAAGKFALQIIHAGAV